MSPHTANENPAILSYHAMATLVGMITSLLPFVLGGGTILLALIGPGHTLPQPILQRSISDYYYTAMGSVYVGSLFVVGAFLICSRGYERTDEIAGYLAGLFTIGVALFPSEDPHLTHYSRLQINIGFAHTAFAALMFLAIAYFCLFLFRRSSPHRKPTRSKQHRNVIYTVCGVVIVVCICLIVIFTLNGVARSHRPFNPLLVSESIALEAFGVAWLTKGERILRDRPHERIHTLVDTATPH
jgi:hypothetical protein